MPACVDFCPWCCMAPESTLEFPDDATMRGEIGKRAPDLIFQNVSLESADAIEAVVALGKAGYRGAVQLTSNRGAAVLDHQKYRPFAQAPHVAGAQEAVRP
jgi:hypothetical protein